MKSAKPQFWVLMAILASFMGWLATLVFYMFPRVFLNPNPEAISQATQFMAAMGAGGVTVFFTTILTLGVQFFFRKAAPPDTNKVGG